jgi:hypothetical protein
MKNMEFWSRETDWKILIVAAALSISGFAGLLHVWPEFLNIPWVFGTGVALALLLLPWGLFNLVRPIRARWDRRWSIAEAIVVPIAWLLLLIALSLWFYHVAVHERKKIEDLIFIIAESEYFRKLPRTR